MPLSNSEFDQKATFIQHLLPGLSAGTYILEAEQEIWEKGKTKKLDSTSLRRLISVESSRLSAINNLVESCYPPDRSASKGPGPYDTCLPHVVLKDVPGLPWLREPTILDQNKEPLEHHGVKHDPDIAPWLAVLLIHEEDLKPSNGFLFSDFNNIVSRGLKNQLVPEGCDIYDYNLKGIYELSKLEETDRKGRMSADCYSLFSHPQLQAHEGNSKLVDLGLADKPNEACIYTTLKMDFFQSIAPTLEDLKFMAHIRQVDTALQPRNKVAPAIQRYGVVLSNRIPKKGKAFAMLVSLENLEDALPSSGVSLAEKYIRLPVLYNWQFEVGEDTSAEFEYALKTLNGTTYQESTAEVQLQHPHFNLKDTAADAYDPKTKKGRIQEALKKGYVPFNHITRGEEGINDPVQTVSWYRGPLVPYRVPVGQVVFKEQLADGSALVHSAHSADELLRYDKDLQMFDTSYAAAWQLGKMLCLENNLVAGELYEWKRANEHRVIAQCEADLLIDQIPHLASSNDGIDDASLHEPTAFQQLSHYTIQSLIDLFESA